MKVKFLKNETICFDGINNTIINKGDFVEVEKINKVSGTLLDFYTKNGYVEIKENKSLNPIEGNKAITSVEENKGLTSFFKKKKGRTKNNN